MIADRHHLRFSYMSNCFALSPAILLYTWLYGGFWPTAIRTSALQFGYATNQLWAVPPPTSDVRGRGRGMAAKCIARVVS